MPDLSHTATSAWVQAIEPVRPVEDWPPAFRPLELSGDAPALIEELGHLLDLTAGERATGLSLALRSPPLADGLRIVLAQTGAARVFRLFHWLDERQLPDSQIIVAALIDGDRPGAAALRATIAAFAQRQLLNRMFAPDRIAALQAAAQTALKDTA